MDMPDCSSVLELGEALRQGRLDDTPLRQTTPSLASFVDSTIESRYDKWRRCDDVIAHYKENQATETRQKDYLQVVLCSGRSLCPDVTESWANCVKHWKGDHELQCQFVKRMVERCLRGEATEMLRLMDPAKFPK
ncbi:hypothetical protein H257_03331 [Aphanomyces astaci]|uniref:Uncharacterized protein n=2 Tax=Aphanomyces astaci TaxID=112090 RepID=W4GW91_APHAT|nr:hypothetical protein H257_03331 [Aphanomyces astaci]ETV83952.1 hypothetical protein H257_03331 [Aphanomyces astaci]|eukprot:XP_009825644.1 hypothetical protein H257_03331 [Aphanomyces astaci]